MDLVDINSDPIAQVTPDGILTASGRFRKLDVIALATGFDFITGSMLAMGVRGRGARQLDESWNVHEGGNGVATYFGLKTSGFPNMFFPMGPQAPSALGLTPHLAEIQGDWIADLLVWMQAHGKTVLEPTLEAELRRRRRRFERRMNRCLVRRTRGTWDECLRTSSQVSALTLHLRVNIPPWKRQPLCYFGGVDRYIQKLKESELNGYDGFDFRERQSRKRRRSE